jgi:hypothetical protein
MLPGLMDGETRAAWQKRLQNDVYTLDTEENKLLASMVGPKDAALVWWHSHHHKACLVDASIDCNQAFAAATAICALYGVAPVAGEVAASICETAAVGGYLNCLNATGQ